ncbi:MAG: hypothetical protein J6J35_03540, partial [Alphaproteobacteria bacterium]|nr:hypothetical protein [Alphaproteobacteria bacterium]
GTLVCYAKQEAKTCADYGYLSSCPSGQTGTAHSVKLGATTSTCYSDCKGYYKVTLQGIGAKSCDKCDFGPCIGSTCSKKATSEAEVEIAEGETVTITSSDSSKANNLEFKLVQGSTTTTESATGFSFTMPASDVAVRTTPKDGSGYSCGCDSYFTYVVVTSTNSNKLYARCYQSSTGEDTQNIGSMRISFGGKTGSASCPSGDATITCGADSTYITNLSDESIKYCYSWGSIASVSCDDGKQVAHSSGDTITCNGKKIKVNF